MRIKSLVSATLLAVALATAPTAAIAAEKTAFKLGWSIYVGWMPWGWADDTGIVKKWADKYGITIEVTQFNDYVESINQFTASDYDAVTLTNMDALSIPSAGGVDTSVVVINDYSNGNDMVIAKNAKDVAGLKGEKINLVELSVSEYLLVRALETAGLTSRDVTVVNTSDADMVAAAATPDVSTVVTWNPLASEIVAAGNGTAIFDSSKIPGEIMDLTVAKTEVLADNPAFGKALAGIWYETMGVMTAETPEGAAARAAMGASSGTDQKGFESQLSATNLFATPQAGLDFVNSADLSAKMDAVRQFLFAKGLFGAGAASADIVGIALANGDTLGDPANVKLRFDPVFMQAAADGKL
ncbi:ABC transporter substrate-binding protein [Aureimonas sp. SA4125]|uniref:putative urea ABC transporter substrate-binding protein n=1 Tax=Aureimonas sp. SA4125 TaxID=2826993 RepID=UPI001CC55436|nr:putative urea ABC transporter substrate-binding protein [Aureimonas sp. SA4125]BDA84405.1 ABC transporter substrate-binding protein [Aureimonas sp. SA4125]